MSKIGASDAPIIMNNSPFKTAYTLWEEKLGLREPPPMNFAMQRGHGLENYVRQELNKHYDTQFIPLCVEHDEIPFMSASLDGNSQEKGITIEIKCPSKKDHDYVKEMGLPPSHYYEQLLHLQHISKDQVIYASFREGEIITCDFIPDKARQEDLLEKEEIFYQRLKNQEPPPITSKDFVEVSDESGFLLANEFVETEKKIKELEKKLKDIKSSFSLNHPKTIIKCSFGNLILQEIVRKGNVDYNQIEELKSIDLESYRKKPTKFIKFNLKK